MFSYKRPYMSTCRVALAPCKGKQSILCGMLLSRLSMASSGTQMRPRGCMAALKSTLPQARTGWQQISIQLLTWPTMPGLHGMTGQVSKLWHPACVCVQQQNAAIAQNQSQHVLLHLSALYRSGRHCTVVTAIAPNNMSLVLACIANLLHSGVAT